MVIAGTAEVLSSIEVFLEVTDAEVIPILVLLLTVVLFVGIVVAIVKEEITGSW